MTFASRLESLVLYLSVFLALALAIRLSAGTPDCCTPVSWTGDSLARASELLAAAAAAAAGSEMENAQPLNTRLLINALDLYPGRLDKMLLTCSRVR